MATPKPTLAKTVARKAFWKWRFVRRLYWLWCWALDRWDQVRGKRQPLVPPRTLLGLACGGVFQFLESGRADVRHLIAVTGLRPEERILDVGCGPGRLAVALTSYLSPAGTYDGLDIVPQYIRWCAEAIGMHHANFRFHLADVSNAAYQPTGSRRALEYALPFAEESFDLVLLTSVFTHMLPEDVAHYLAEVRRVLRRGQRCVITYFLWNTSVEARVKAGASDMDFPYDRGCYRTLMPNLHEADVCYDETFVLELYRRCGLTIQPPICYGRWSGRQPAQTYQDLIIARKAA